LCAFPGSVQALSQVCSVLWYNSTQCPVVWQMHTQLLSLQQALLQAGRGSPERKVGHLTARALPINSPTIGHPKGSSRTRCHHRHCSATESRHGPIWGYSRSHGDLVQRLGCRHPRRCAGATHPGDGAKHGSGSRGHPGPTCNLTLTRTDPAHGPQAALTWRLLAMSLSPSPSLGSSRPIFGATSRMKTSSQPTLMDPPEPCRAR
jgi:hypothetical protein